MANNPSFLRACCAALSQGYKWATWPAGETPTDIDGFTELFRTEAQRDASQSWHDYNLNQGRFPVSGGTLAFEVVLEIEAAATDEELARQLAEDLLAMTPDEARGLKTALTWHANRRARTAE